MLRLPPFEFYSPSSITEAVALKTKYGSVAMYSAGGTDLFPNMKRRQVTPQILIGLRELRELQSIELDDGLTIGAGVSLSRIAQHPQIRENYPALVKAAALVSAPQLRNMGTIGGNLCLDTRCTYYNQSYQWRKALGFCLKKSGDTCWVARSSPKCLAVSSSDCAPVMLALEAEFCLANPEGVRTIPASEFYLNDGTNYLNKTADELLVSIHLPQRKVWTGLQDKRDSSQTLNEDGKYGSGWQTNYRKLRRRESIDFPVLGVATALCLDDSGVCSDARIVLGAVASSPLRAFEAEEVMRGKKLTDERIETAAQAAAKLAKPMENTDMTLGFRKKMVTNFVAETILESTKNHS